MGIFKIELENLCWIDGTLDNPKDLCLHGDVTVQIGDETFKYNATVSATALYLLKTVSQNHIIYKENQMLPCCGDLLIANDDLSNVDIYGCPNGIDWTVIHNGGNVKIVTENNKETIVNINDYIEEVYKFADKVDSFYKKCTAKILPDDEFDRNGYIAFWNEWNRRRNK